jgi:hypothetical protein
MEKIGADVFDGFGEGKTELFEHGMVLFESAPF